VSLFVLRVPTDLEIQGIHLVGESPGMLLLVGKMMCIVRVA